jgi:hypothetical protein
MPTATARIAAWALACAGRTAASHGTAAPRQNWILDPLQDALLVIAAPLLVLSAALLAFQALGGAQAASLTREDGQRALASWRRALS